MTRTKAVWAAAALGVLGAAGWSLRGRWSKPSEPAGHLVSAEEGSIEDVVEATGSVAPLNRVEIKPPIAGRMEQLLAQEGERVQAGQIMAWMSSSDRAAILDAARAKGPEELARWQDAYKATPIVAPLSGVLILRNVVVGQTVDAGAILFAMSDSLIVVAQVDEADIARVRVGMPARVTLDAFPGRTAQGRVFDILYEGKNVSNVIQYGVKIRPVEVPDYYRSQMTANVNFIAAKRERTVIVPATTVREDPDGGKFVLVPGPDGAAARRPVKTGVETGEKIEILEGLRPGDRLLLTASQYVPQRGPQASPFAGGGRPGGQPTGQAPRPRARRGP